MKDVLALAFLCIIAVSSGIRVPTYNAANFERETTKREHTFVLFYESGDADSDAALKEYEQVFKSYRNSHQLICAAFNLKASADREFATDELSVERLPLLAHFRPNSDTHKLYKGKLTSSAMRNWMIKKSGHRPDGEKTVQSIQDMFHYLHHFTTLESVFLSNDAQGKQDILAKMKQNAEELSLLPYGGDYDHVAEEHVKIMESIIEKEWTQSEIRKEANRLKRLLQGKLAPSKQKETADKVEVYESYISQIPKIVHFIKVDSRRHNFNMLHYLAIRTAAHWIKPKTLFFHTPVEPSGDWWERAKPYVTLNFVNPPYEVKGKMLKLAAHQSDFLRLRLLIEHGGIYMDWDVVTMAPFDDILNSTTVMGMERKVPNYNEVMGVAVMMSRPGSPWFKRFLSQMEDVFDGDKCYACHSTGLGRQLGLEWPEEVRILNYTSFYHPGWDEDAVRLMFDPAYYKPGKSMADGMFYAVHMFESHKNFQEIAIPKLTVDHFYDVDSHFTVLMRPFLKEEWRSKPAKKRKGKKAKSSSDDEL